MKIDISELNYQDLLNLEKEIEKAKKKQLAAYKTNLLDGERVYDIFTTLVADNDFGEDEQRKVRRSVEAAIFTICDYTLGNYKDRYVKGNRVINRSGSLILDDKVRPYESMCNDILDVIEKYAKEDRK